MSLKQTIYEYLKSQYPKVVHKGEIGRKAILEWGYLNENAGRRCRELENEGKIKKVPNLKGEARYQWTPNSAEDCCISYAKFSIHARSCYTQHQEKEKLTLF